MDLSRLSLGDKLAVVGGIVALIASFLPWYSWSSGSVFGVPGVNANVNLWDASGGLAFLLLAGAVVGIAVIILRMFEIFDLSDQGVPEGLVVLVAAGLVGLVALIRVLSIPGGAGIVGYGRSWGLWVGLVGAVIYILGAFMKFQEER